MAVLPGGPSTNVRPADMAKGSGEGKAAGALNHALMIMREKPRPADKALRLRRYSPFRPALACSQSAIAKARADRTSVM